MADRALEAAVEAARAAGEIALKYYRTGFEVTMKPDLTPVTQADREAERVIVEILERAFPSYGVLGEEFGARGPRDRRWIIDPIDGTRNFVRRIPFWATLIALEEQGEITTGVIHNPVTGDLYTARRGEGAWLNGAPIRVSEIARLADAHLLHAGLSLLRQSGYWEGFVRLVDATDRQRGFGDYLGYTLLAEGKAEIYAEVDLKPWDLAPCKIVVEEAGGRFTDFEGRSTIYTGTAVATNGRLHDPVLALLRP
ncbi:MAG TPA: inositol monophosphatase family protein [Methylomirabilota bacterium]|jgi:histidinol-phosphatase|nr:inositol monophosphatase family protein [Methylomirabilota bacterium]